jgi:hypothetical protein
LLPRAARKHGARAIREQCARKRRQRDLQGTDEFASRGEPADPPEQRVKYVCGVSEESHLGDRLELAGAATLPSNHAGRSSSRVEHTQLLLERFGDVDAVLWPDADGADVTERGRGVVQAADAQLLAERPVCGRLGLEGDRESRERTQRKQRDNSAGTIH